MVAVEVVGIKTAHEICEIVTFCGHWRWIHEMGAFMETDLIRDCG
jgi:hypothetical protein